MKTTHAELKGKRVAILVTDGFEQAEFVRPKEKLEQEGVETTVISSKTDPVQGFHHLDKGDQFKVNMTFEQANPVDFDGVLLPGGVTNGDQMRVIEKAKHFVQQMDSAGKPIFVICHGGWVLVSAGLVKERTMTSWPTLRDDIENAGGKWTDQEVVVDNNWVSSRKPDDIPAFNEKMIEALREATLRALPPHVNQTQQARTATSLPQTH